MAEGDEEKTEEEIAQEEAAAAFEAAKPPAGAPLMAARVGDHHACPMVDGTTPHVGGPILPPGEPTVLIGGRPAATVGTQATCASAPDVIVKGSSKVVINNKPAARQGDQTAHGGIIAIGEPKVVIGG